MSTEFNTSWLMRHLARKAAAPTHCDALIEVEMDLHEQITAECSRRGWLAFHGAMSKATHRTGGEPDFVILTDLRRAPTGLLLVECKSRTGKVSVDQQAIAAWAKKLGHTVHVVRSFQEFLSVAMGPIHHSKD